MGDDLRLDSIAAAACAERLGRVADGLGQRRVPMPAGFDASQEACLDAQWQVQQSLRRLSGFFRGIADNTRDSAAGFEAAEDAIEASTYIKPPTSSTSGWSPSWGGGR